MEQIYPPDHGHKGRNAGYLEHVRPVPERAQNIGYARRTRQIELDHEYGSSALDRGHYAAQHLDFQPSTSIFTRSGSRPRSSIGTTGIVVSMNRNLFAELDISSRSRRSASLRSPAAYAVNAVPRKFGYRATGFGRRCLQLNRRHIGNITANAHRRRAPPAPAQARLRHRRLKSLSKNPHGRGHGGPSELNDDR
jgi:hypothetical protein